MIASKKQSLFLLMIFVFLSSCGANNNSIKSLNLSSKVDKVPFSLFLKGYGSYEISQKIEENASKHHYGYYYLSMSSLEQLNKILSENKMEVYVRSNELKKISKSFFKNNKIYLVFFVGTANTRIKANKITKQDNTLTIDSVVKNSIDLAITTDCLVIGITKTFGKDVKKLRVIWD